MDKVKRGPHKGNGKQLNIKDTIQAMKTVYAKLFVVSICRMVSPDSYITAPLKAVSLFTFYYTT